MKIKKGFERKQIGRHDMVCRTKEDGKLDLWFALNETGGFLWDGLMEGKGEDVLVRELMKEYEASPEEADMIRNDVEDFIDQLRKVGVLED